MEEENFLIRIIVAAIVGLPIFILLNGGCAIKTYRKSIKIVKENVSNHHHHRQEPQKETSKTRSSASDECTECQRFDQEVDTALKAKPGITIVNKDGRCCINEHEISPKQCHHGIGNESNVITINKPELQMSTYVGNGVVMKVNKRKLTIKSTNMGKARDVKMYGNGVTIKWKICGKYISIFDKIFNNGYTICNNYVSPECSECSKYDEKIAETTKATIIRDSSGEMIIISSTCMNIVNQNGKTFINCNKIKSKSCQHPDINCCSIYYSSNIIGILNSSIFDSKNINAKSCSIEDCKIVIGTGCVINDCKDVYGINCAIIVHCSKVVAENCTIYDSSIIKKINCVCFAPYFPHSLTY